MDGRLNENGELSIKRANGWMEAICPFSDGSSIPCGTWCPHFSEPMLQRNTKFEGRMETVIHMCFEKHWKFRNFEDRRQIV